MKLARLIASGFGSGFFPWAPGTVGSLAALAIGAAILATVPAWLPLLALLTAAAGLWAVHRCAAGDDPGWVVIDEFAGQFIAIIALPGPAPLGLLVAFLLFRLLDIAKPGPIGWADRQPGAAGVIGDDVIAGGIAAGIIWAVRSRYPELMP